MSSIEAAIERERQPAIFSCLGWSLILSQYLFLEYKMLSFLSSHLNSPIPNIYFPNMFLSPSLHQGNFMSPVAASSKSHALLPVDAPLQHKDRQNVDFKMIKMD